MVQKNPIFEAEGDNWTRKIKTSQLYWYFFIHSTNKTSQIYQKGKKRDVRELEGLDQYLNKSEQKQLSY
jgi:hypothetical protein